MSDNRDWQADMTLCEKAQRDEGWSKRDMIAQQPQMSIYWLQQYAELEKEHAYAKKQAIMWNDKAVVEKGRANRAEEEAEKWRVEAFKQHPTQDAYDAACAALHKHRERADQAEAREQKLKEAIEAAINEKAQWGDAGNALDVIVRYLSDTLSTLYPKEAVE